MRTSRRNHSPFAESTAPGEHLLPKRRCADCGQSMPDVGRPSCASCDLGPFFSRSSEAAAKILRERDLRAEVRALRPRPLSLAMSREDAAVHLDRFERGETAIAGEVEIRDPRLS